MTSMLHGRLVASVFVLVLAACGAGSRAMVGPPGSSAAYPMEVLAQGDVLIVRVEQPGGSNVVVYEPALEQGRLALEAGLWSGGNPGEQVQCFDVARLSAPADWPDRIVWRDRVGTLTPVEVARGERAAALARSCPSR